MLWEGGWEWARLTKSKYISIEVTCPLPLPLPLYLFLISILLPLPVRCRSIGHSSPPVVFALKNRRFVRSYPQKKRKTLLLKIWSTPIALPAPRWDLLLSLIC